MANYLSQPGQGIALNSWLLALCSKSYPCPGGSWKMQEFCQQQLCWSRAVANAALLTLPSAPFSDPMRLHTVRNYLFQRCAPHQGQETSWMSNTGLPLNSLSRKKVHTEAGGEAKLSLGIWGSTGCLEGAEVSYIWSLWSPLPHRQKFTLNFWLDDPSKTPASCTERNFKLLNLCSAVLRWIR